MKKTILVSLAGLTLFLAGCTFQTPTADQNINQPMVNIDQNTNQPPKTLTYLISKEAESKYCNGADMDSDGYRKTIITEVTTTIPIDAMTETELAKATVIAATAGQCQNVLKQNDLRVAGDTVYIAPIDAWAGISITMCSCMPQIEVNLLRLPGIKKVIYEKAVNQNINANQPAVNINQNVNTNTNSEVSKDLKSEYISLSREYDLKYDTYEEAVEAFKKALGMDVEPSYISFRVPGKVPREDGKPYFILDATTSYGRSSTKKDFCQKGWFSLIDDNIKFWEDYCGPIN